MAQRQELLSISYHYDDETGMHHIGEIDFGINGKLESFLTRFGYKGKEEVMAMIAYLGFEVQDTWNQLQNKIQKDAPANIGTAGYQPTEQSKAQG